ncbi:Orf1 [Seal anellovirus TFFN/USA/2006]|uniref:Capsid protein n=1 Tax=Seal anellovirus TFFN/USA/2006 TaxID=991022 RepID=F1CHU5_9VIRU|nr:Orf1 [Seal anellovirus TFFN/USA/2006]ADZ04933.1 ORF1 [Seal anellovirus TFFN/USA/2006]
MARRFRRRFQRWRRGRYHPRRGYRRWRPFHHWRHWRRRGRYFRHRTAAVRYRPSRRHKVVVCRGWEPLGNVCKETLASQEATPYKDIEADYDPTTSTLDQFKGSWQGTWGHHYFTLENLVKRNRQLMNTFTSDWRGWDYYQFLGGVFYMPKISGMDYFIYLDYDLQDLKAKGDETDLYKHMKSWIHPGIYMNRYGAKMITSPHRTTAPRLFRKVRIKPPASWEGLYPINTGFKYIFCHWAWTVFDWDMPFFDSYCYLKSCATKPPKPMCEQCCNERPWWSGLKDSHNMCKPNFDDNFNDSKEAYDARATWVRRDQYQMSSCESNTPETGKDCNCFNWGPFLPQCFPLWNSWGRSVWFKYKLFFKFSGDSVYRRTVSKDSKDLIPEAPKGKYSQGEIPSSSSPRRPLDEADILRGDLDPSGILTERAYRGITRPGGEEQPTMLVPKRVRFRRGDIRRKRLRHLLSRLMER